MSHKRKYNQSFKRCAGDGCMVKDKCARHEAITEARDNDCAHGCYIEAKVCMQHDCSEFVSIEVEVSE